MSIPSTTPLPESGAPLPLRSGVPPYAVPASRGAGDNGSVRSAGPYVPAAWRTHHPAGLVASSAAIAAVESALPTPANVESLFGVEVASGSATTEQGTSDDSLPWIDAFLSTTPAVPMTAIAADELPWTAAESELDAASSVHEEAPAAEFSDAFAASADIPEIDEVVVTEESDSGILAPATSQEAEDWPLEQAASEFDALAQHLEALAPPVSTEPAALFAEPTEPEPLPAWSDDDMVDIMPVRQPIFTPRSLGAQPSDRMGAQAAHRDDNAEAAAHALELLAGRVRAGELPLAGYEPRMGDAAALVAALAALLGVKLG